MIRRLVLLTLLAAGARAGAVTNGREVPAGEFPAVVHVVPFTGVGATGTFVGPRTLLTAAHTVRGGGVSFEGVRSTAVWTNPAWRGLVGPADFAVVQFDRDLAPAVATISLGAFSAGLTVTLVGYGSNDLSDRHHPRGAGTKRAGTNTLDNTGGGRVAFFGSLLPNDPAFPLGTHVASAAGDSGGPLWVEDRVAGLVSGGIVDTRRQLAWSVGVDLSSAGSQEVMARATLAGASISGFSGVITCPPAVSASR